MRTILIAYDLVGTDESSADYARLIDHIKTAYSNWARVAKSVWIIRTTQAAKQVRDNCKAYMDSNDRPFVAVLTGEAAWTKVMCRNEWLKENL
jgi:hypothetical protein